MITGSDTKNIHGLKSSDITLLSCNSQAYPVPLHRWVLFTVGTLEFWFVFEFESRLIFKSRENFDFMIKFCFFRAGRLSWTKNQHWWQSFNKLGQNFRHFKFKLSSSSFSDSFISVRHKNVVKKSMKFLGLLDFDCFSYHLLEYFLIIYF